MIVLSASEALRFLGRGIAEVEEGKCEVMLAGLEEVRRCD